MAADDDLTPLDPDRTVTRRTIVKTAAWALPAVMVAGAAPAYAASCPGISVTLTGGVDSPRTVHIPDCVTSVTFTISGGGGNGAATVTDPATGQAVAVGGAGGDGATLTGSLIGVAGLDLTLIPASRFSDSATPALLATCGFGLGEGGNGGNGTSGSAYGFGGGGGGSSAITLSPSGTPVVIAGGGGGGSYADTTYTADVVWTTAGNGGAAGAFGGQGVVTLIAK